MDTEQKQTFDLEALRTKLASTTGRQYWRGLGELAENEEFIQYLEDEVPQATRSMGMYVDRRQFLTLAGAGLALAGLSGCRFQPQRKIVPYVKMPEDMTLGIPSFFATAVPSLSGTALGVIATTREGRPIKLEGNPDHPDSLGKTDAVTQSLLIGMYDPDRSQTVMNQGEVSAWKEFYSTARDAFARQRTTRGNGVRVLTETITSPTFAAQMKNLLVQFPEAKWIQYEPEGRDNVRAGAIAAFGEPVNTIYKFDQASRILSLDADFLLTMPGHVRYAGDFIKGRRVRRDTKDMNRLYVVEGMPTITGANADQRLPLRPSEIEGFARAVAQGIGVDVGGTPVPTFNGDNAKYLTALIKDLKSAAAGTTLVIPGDFQPAPVHALVHAINAQLGNAGKTVLYTDPVEAVPSDQLADLKTLVADISASKVDVLLILGGNPVYNAPADLRFSEQIVKVPFSIHLSAYEDETSFLSKWHLPEAHFMEAWGDIRAYEGTTSIIQPMIAPLYDGKSAHEVISALIEEPREGYQIVRDHYRSQGVITEDDFNKILHDGVVAGSASKLRPVTLKPGAASAVSPAIAKPSGSTLEVVIRPDTTIGDGRYANNGWLQELPKPILKITWDNVAVISPATAAALHIPYDKESASNTPTAELTVRGSKITAPVWILPGHPDDTVTLTLGYGRERAGSVGSGIGYNAYNVMFSDTLWNTTGTLEGGKGSLPVATTQHHYLMENRDLIRVGSIAQFTRSSYDKERLSPDDLEEQDKNEKGKSHVVEERPNIYNLDEYKYPKDPNNAIDKFGAYSWGMSIDASACIGCNACVSACVAENNTPVVGKDEVLRGRAMHWIRIDTYYASDAAQSDAYFVNPKTYFMPVMCVHCEQAPCEPVCPVAATIHSHEGLNMMVYNRCVGTKYCSNNCPYKVRRFNFFNYANHHDVPVRKLLNNPEVTVRGRGVMEKCSYCTQRISLKRQQAKQIGVEIKDGELVTACQQACPTDAIVFGNISDLNAAVSKLKTEPHDYALLGELNTRPRTTYLARVNNPNPEIESEASQSEKTRGDQQQRG